MAAHSAARGGIAASPKRTLLAMAAVGLGAEPQADTHHHRQCPSLQMHTHAPVQPHARRAPHAADPAPAFRAAGNTARSFRYCRAGTGRLLWRARAARKHQQPQILTRYYRAADTSSSVTPGVLHFCGRRCVCSGGKPAAEGRSKCETSLNSSELWRDANQTHATSATITRGFA